jgi:nucleoporin NDC1
VNPVLPAAAVPTPSSSPSQRVRATISKPLALRAVSVYILTSILISASHILFGHVFESTPRASDNFGIFVKSRYSPFILASSSIDSPLSIRKHPYYLNGRFLFLYMAQITLAIGFHFRNVLLDRPTIHWTLSQVCRFTKFSRMSRLVYPNRVQRWPL